MKKIDRFEETKKEILSRHGACFGISCRDCPLGEESNISCIGMICRGGGQGEYQDIIKALQEIDEKEKAAKK